MSQPSRPARRGLGRGLGALIPTAPTSPTEAAGDATQDRFTTDGTDGTDGADATPRPAGSDASSGGAPVPRSDRQDGDAPAPAGDRAGSPTDGVGTQSPGGPPDTADRGADPALVVAGAYFREVPLGQVRPNPRQPRQVFDEEALAELVHSIGEIGLLQPIVVRESDNDTFELIMGERRWRAAQQAGLEAIPAIVRQTDDGDMLRDALLENLHRSQLNPLEEAAAYGQLLEDFGCTHEELAQRIGRSRPQISNTLRLLKLTPTVQRRVAAGVLSAGHARALLAVADADQQDRLAGRVVAEGISVRALEEIVALGENEASPRPGRRKKPVAPGLVDLADRLSDRFETRVKVDLGKSKGKITVEFASLEDLQRIVDVMDPGMSQAD